VIGFPIALVIAWAFELTPQGLKRTEDVDPAAQGQRKSHAWIYVVIVGAALSIGLFFLGRYTVQHTGPGAAAIDKSIGTSVRESATIRRTPISRRVFRTRSLPGWRRSPI
jgi:phosphate/sulfate permease